MAIWEESIAGRGRSTRVSAATGLLGWEQNTSELGGSRRR